LPAAGLVAGRTGGIGSAGGLRQAYDAGGLSERTFAVLSPAFRGCEGGFALQSVANKGCNFLLSDRMCELHATPFLPLECAFCHHDRIGQGKQCHADLEKDWQSPAGKALVRRWCKQMDWWDLLDSFGLGWLKK
jgi:hypothetical protein